MSQGRTMLDYTDYLENLVGKYWIYTTFSEDKVSSQYPYKS